MAKKVLIDSIIKLYSKLGGNVGEALGSRTNVSFLGVGKSPEGFIDSTLNIEAVGSLGKSKVLEELKSSIGYLTANKLNDIQAGKLYENMLKLDEFYNPKQIANITDMATGTRDLTEEGLGALRATRKTDDDVRIIKDEALKKFPEETHQFMGRPLKDADFVKIDQLVKEGKIPAAGSESEAALPPKTLLNDVQEMQKRMVTSENAPKTIADRISSDVNAMKRTGSNEIESLETMVQNKAGNEFITGFVDDVYKNSGAVSSVDVPKKRAAARMFLNSMLKKETDLLPPGKGGTLESVVTEADYKYITEGGGGALGDPLIIVKKYFGDEVAKRIPLDTRTEVIETFVDNVRFTKDRAGFPNDDPRFNPDDLPEFAEGGLAGILQVPRTGFKYGSRTIARGALAFLNKNKKNSEYMFKASDNVSPGYAKGDMKYNAELLADQLAEDAGVVYDDLDHVARSEFYGAAYDYLAQEMGMMKKLLGEVDESMTRQALHQWDPGKGRKPSASGGLAKILEV